MNVYFLFIPVISNQIITLLDLILPKIVVKIILGIWIFQILKDHYGLP